MKMNEEEMKTKEEEEEEHLTRFHLQVKKKTETLLGPCGVCKGVRGVRGVRGRVRAESAWGPWSLWSPWGPWSPWSPRALWARIGPIPESEVKIHKKRFPKKGSYRVPKIYTQNYMVVVPAGFASQGFSRFPRLHTLYRSPQTSQVRVPK